MRYFRGRQRGNHLYGITSCREQDDSLDGFIGTIQVFNFDIFSEQHLDPFSILTHVENPILAQRVYPDFPICINPKNTMPDLVELGMVDFDVILGMG